MSRREFIAHGGYSAGDGNQCISNFKKKPETRNTFQWPHRMRAVDQFAKELSSIVPPGSTLATIPTSKIRGQPDYCDRFEELAVRLVNRRSDLIMVTPITRIQTAGSLHSGQRTRCVEDEVARLEWVGFPGPAPARLYLVDDVITAGTMFKACKRFLAHYSPTTTAVGIFWRGWSGPTPILTPKSDSGSTRQNRESAISRTLGSDELVVQHHSSDHRSR